MKQKFLSNCLITLLFTSTLYSYASTTAYQLSTKPRPLTEDEKSAIVNATEEFLGATYKESFNSMQFIFPDYNGNKYGGYCGLVKIKNSNGQYGGYNPFLLFFRKDDQHNLSISFGATLTEENSFLRDPLLQKCANNHNLRYDLEPIIEQEEKNETH